MITTGSNDPYAKFSQANSPGCDETLSLRSPNYRNYVKDRLGSHIKMPYTTKLDRLKVPSEKEEQILINYCGFKIQNQPTLVKPIRLRQLKSILDSFLIGRKI